MMDILTCFFMSLMMVAEGLVVRGPSGPLVAPLGSSVVLPCYVDEPLPMEHLEVEWRRTDSETVVQLFLDGRAESQQQDYHDRAHFFTDQIQHGNFSLRLDNLTAEDEGDYTCTVYSEKDSGETVVQIKRERFLVSGSDQSVSASDGEDVTLNCSVDSHIPLEDIEVSWIRTDGDIPVLLFLNNETLPDSSDEQYRDRVEFFSAETPKGNFSLRLKSVRTEDKGVYMCQVFSGGLSANTTVELEQLGGETTMNDIKMDSATLAMFDNKLASKIVSAIHVIVTLANLIGNGISLFLLVKSLKTPSIIFMINLTITDLIVGTVLPFQIVYQMQGYNWTWGSSMCKVLTVVFFVNMYCSILFMTAISADHYLRLVKPMRFRGMRRRKTYAIFACIFIWLLVLVILIPLESTELTYEVKERNIITCFDVWRKDMLLSTAHWVGFLFGIFIILFLCPFIITVYCNINIICVLVRKSPQKGCAVRLACIVLFVYIFCFAPNNILLLARLFYDKSLYIYYKLTLSLSCFNSCIDPFIYYFASKEFRWKLRQLLRLLRQLLDVQCTKCDANEDCDNL